jgi:hypothetical protein
VNGRASGRGGDLHPSDDLTWRAVGVFALMNEHQSALQARCRLNLPDGRGEYLLAQSQRESDEREHLDSQALGGWVDDEEY